MPKRIVAFNEPAFPPRRSRDAAEGKLEQDLRNKVAELCSAAFPCYFLVDDCVVLVPSEEALLDGAVCP